MRNAADMMQYVFAAIGGALGAVMGGFDGFLYALIVFVVVDYVTGVMVGILNKELSSQIGFRGIFKKVVIFSLVAVAHIIDTHVIGNGSVLRTEFSRRKGNLEMERERLCHTMEEQRKKPQGTAIQKSLKRCLPAKKLDRAMVECFLEKVRVYENRRMEASLFSHEEILHRMEG